MFAIIIIRTNVLKIKENFILEKIWLKLALDGDLMQNNHVNIYR